MTFWRDLISSIQFLSRFPVHRLPEGLRGDTSPRFDKSAYTFPLAGGFIALPAALTIWIAQSIGLPALASAVLAIIVLIFCTGALHEDGLADVADGFWGGFTKERKLEIMRDSSIGAYGVLSLILSLLLKTALLANLIQSRSPEDVALVFISIAAISRMAVLFPWWFLPAARPKTGDAEQSEGKSKSGLSARYGGPSFNTYLIGGLLSIPFAALLWPAAGLWPMVLAIITVKVAVLGFTQLSRHHIGGHTGDVLGATQQISELALLLGLTMAM